MSDEQTIETPATEAPNTPAATPTQEGPRLSRAERLAAATKFAEKEDAAAKPEAAPETADASDSPPPGPDAESTSEAASGLAAKPEDPAKPKDPKDEKLSARFASLARKEAELLKSSTEIGTKARLVEEHARKNAEREQAIAKREQEWAERQRQRDDSEHKLLELESEKLFERLAELGVKDEATLRVVAGKGWANYRARMEREAAASKPVKDEERPMTRAEAEKFYEEKRQREAQEAKARSVYEHFVKLTEEAKNEDGSEKYEAASTIWSRKQRCAKADMIAGALQAQGKSFTPDEIADAVDTLARQHPRWHKIESKRASKPGGASQQPAGTPPATKQPATQARQATPGQTTPTAEKKPAGSTAPQLNGTAALSYREARKQRLANLLKDG